MQSNPSRDTDNLSSSREIPHLVGSQILRGYDHNASPEVHILSQMDSIHTLVSDFFYI
jgi:hypothetical protein